MQVKFSFFPPFFNRSFAGYDFTLNPPFFNCHCLSGPRTDYFSIPKTEQATTLFSALAFSAEPLKITLHFPEFLTVGP